MRNVLFHTTKASPVIHLIPTLFNSVLVEDSANIFLSFSSRHIPFLPYYIYIYIKRSIYIFIPSQTIPSLASEKKIEERKAFVQMAIKAHYEASRPHRACNRGN
jgi:hypothetical protein